MQDLIKHIQDRARKAPLKKIVLPEGHEERVLEAASQLVKAGLAKPIILGDAEKIRRDVKILGVDLSKIEIIDPRRSEKFPDYVETFYNLRKHKGITVDG